MAEHEFKDLDQAKISHAKAQERHFNQIILPLAAAFICFLIWTVITNIGLFFKTITVAASGLFVYFVISDPMYFTWQIEKAQRKIIVELKTGWQISLIIKQTPHI